MCSSTKDNMSNICPDYNLDPFVFDNILFISLQPLSLHLEVYLSGQSFINLLAFRI